MTVGWRRGHYPLTYWPKWTLLGSKILGSKNRPFFKYHVDISYQKPLARTQRGWGTAKDESPLESAKGESPFSQNVKRSLQESRGIDPLCSSVCILPQKSSSWSCALRSCTPASSSMSPTSAKAAKWPSLALSSLGSLPHSLSPKGPMMFSSRDPSDSKPSSSTEDLESRPWPHPSQWSCGRCCSTSCHSWPRTQTSAVSENEPKADSVNPKGFIVC